MGNLTYNCFSEELFYQLGLRQFGDISRLRLEPPPPLRLLVEIAVQAEDSIKGVSLNKAQIVDVRQYLLLSVQLTKGHSVS